MKKIITFFLIIIFILLFIANKSDNSNVVNFSSWGSQSEIKIIKNLIENFETENPNIKVKFIHIPQNYFQKIHLLFASNLAPDVVFTNNQNIQMYIKANLLEDLTPYFSDEENNFYPESLNCFKENEKLYAIPRDISNLVIYYNKDRIKSEPKIKDLIELKNIAQRYTTKEYFGINTEFQPLYWLYFLSANNAGAISDDKKNIIIGEKNSIETLKLYSDFSNKYNIAPKKSEIGSLTTAQMFIDGKLSMYIGGRWMVPKFRETIKFNWDVIEFPSNNNKLYIDASGWAISKSSKNKENAIKLIKFLSSEKAINEFTKTGLIIPARIDSANSSLFLDSSKKPKNNKAFLNMIQNSKPTPVNENYSTINDILNEKTNLIINSDKNPQEIYNDKTIKELERLL